MTYGGHAHGRAGSVGLEPRPMSYALARVLSLAASTYTDILDEAFRQLQTMCSSVLNSEHSVLLVQKSRFQKNSEHSVL